MKRIVVALALESLPLHNILRAARRNSAAIGLDDKEAQWLNEVLDEVQLHQLRGMTQY